MQRKIELLDAPCMGCAARGAEDLPACAVVFMAGSSTPECAGVVAARKLYAAGRPRDDEVRQRDVAELAPVETESAETTCYTSWK